MKVMVWYVYIIAIIVAHILNIKYQWMMIRANSTYFFYCGCLCSLHNIYYIIRYQKPKRCNAVIAMDSAFLVPARCYILYIMTVWYQFCGFATNLFPSLRHRIATG